MAGFTWDSSPGRPSQHRPAEPRNRPRSSSLSGRDLVNEDVTVAREKEVADFKRLIRIVVKGSKKTNDRNPGGQRKTACLVWGGHSEGQFFGKVIQFIAETKFQFCVNSSIDL